MDTNNSSLKMHYELGGMIEVISRKKIETKEDLSLAYTPGIAEPCRPWVRILVPLPGCLLWKENACYLRNLSMWMHSLCSDYPNQINNVLVFPGLFKGALSIRAKEITEK